MSDAKIIFINVWRQCSDEHKRMVRKAWEEQNIPGGDAEIEKRLDQLCCLAFSEDGKLAGISTTPLQVYEPLKRQFYFFRCLVLPEFRGLDLSKQLAIQCRVILEKWAAAHPEEMAMGMASIIESEKLLRATLRPVWPAGLTLIGYTPKGQQIRLGWFDHIQLKHP